MVVGAPFSKEFHKSSTEGAGTGGAGAGGAGAAEAGGLASCPKATAAGANVRISPAIPDLRVREETARRKAMQACRIGTTPVLVRLARKILRSRLFTYGFLTTGLPLVFTSAGFNFGFDTVVGFVRSGTIPIAASFDIASLIRQG